MPSTTRILALAALAAGLLATAYAAALSRHVMLALGVAVAALVVAAVLYAGDASRETVAAVTMAVTVVYGAFTLQLPAAVVAASVVYLTLWVTDEDGPFDATPPELFADAFGADGDGDVDADEPAE